MIEVTMYRLVHKTKGKKIVAVSLSVGMKTGPIYTKTDPIYVKRVLF